MSLFLVHRIKNGSNDLIHVDQISFDAISEVIHSDILRKAEGLQKETDIKRLEIRAGVPTTYAIDSYVIVEYPKTMGEGQGRPSNKLQTVKKGPMKVVGLEMPTNS